jgi:hypothetical protein
MARRADPVDRVDSEPVAEVGYHVVRFVVAPEGDRRAMRVILELRSLIEVVISASVNSPRIPSTSHHWFRASITILPSKPSTRRVRYLQSDEARMTRSSRAGASEAVVATSIVGSIDSSGSAECGQSLVKRSRPGSGIRARYPMHADQEMYPHRDSNPD